MLWKTTVAALGAALLLTSACGDSTSGTDETTAGTTDSTSDGTTAGTDTAGTDSDTGTDTDGVGDLPINGDDAKAWLEANSYSGWEAESAVHAATLGSPHGDVKIFVNAKLATSLGAANTAHPVGAASVKELYDADTLIGWAYYVKIQADSANGDGWYWYEKYIADMDPVGDGNGVALCTGCHSTGVDYVRVDYPLQ